MTSAPGVLGVSLVAKPFKRTFCTLSAWEDTDTLHTFARTEPHRGIMKDLRPTMRTSTFTFWEVPVEQLPLNWEEARRRLAEQQRADAGAGADGR